MLIMPIESIGRGESPERVTRASELYRLKSTRDMIEIGSVTYDIKNNSKDGFDL